MLAPKCIPFPDSRTPLTGEVVLANRYATSSDSPRFPRAPKGAKGRLGARSPRVFMLHLERPLGLRPRAVHLKTTVEKVALRAVKFVIWFFADGTDWQVITRGFLQISHWEGLL